MGRLLAIDYGAKRVGIAVSDPLQLIATSLDTIPTANLLTFLQQYTQTERVEAFIVGMPKRMDNTATHGTPLVENFVRQLQKQFPDTPVHLVDERFTSKMAVQTMVAGGLKKKDRQNKANVDKISAVIILQSFMDARK